MLVAYEEYNLRVVLIEVNHKLPKLFFFAEDYKVVVQAALEFFWVCFPDFEVLSVQKDFRDIEVIESSFVKIVRRNSLKLKRT